MRLVLAALLTLLLTPASASAETATVRDLIDRLEQVARGVAESDATRADFDAFVDRRGLAADDALYRDFVRVKVAFEATRAGGLWDLRWTITDQEPRSDAVWERWHGLTAPGGRGSAFAECDELSALFAFVARELGVDGVGLFWPTWNHTVAVWKLEAADGSPVRVVLATSQVFLDPEQGFDTESFDPWTQKTIYTYTRRDAASDLTLDSELVDRFVEQVRLLGRASFATLQTQRNVREMLQVGLTDLDNARSFSERAARSSATPEDAAAWRAFLQELSR